MTDDLVTDELVERAARAMSMLKVRHQHGFLMTVEYRDDIIEKTWRDHLPEARAALLAIAPAIHAAGYRAGLERAAEVAVAKAAAHDAAAERMVTSALILQANSRADTCEDIATAIRAEKEPRHD